MVRRRPSTIELVRTLSALDKPYVATADLQRLLGLSGKTVAVTLGRLVKTGVLRRLRRNVYVLSTQPVDIERLAMALRFPAYLSFESALARHGILSQLPHSVTLATTRPSAREVIAGRDVVYSHLPPPLFWGYTSDHGLQVAEPEKALLDQLYMLANGQRSLALAQLDLRGVDRDRLFAYAARFPRAIDRYLTKLAHQIGAAAPIGGRRD